MSYLVIPAGEVPSEAGGTAEAKIWVYSKFEEAKTMARNLSLEYSDFGVYVCKLVGRARVGTLPTTWEDL